MTPVPWPIQVEARRQLLALRETLVRCDENEKAYHLLKLAPFFLEDDPEVQRAKDEQYAMVKHILGAHAYEAYYATNAHERPFEEQYGIEPGEAHQYLSRVAHLRERLVPCARVADLACNDGWLAANLQTAGIEWYDGVDLNPRCIERAIARDVDNTTFSNQSVETMPPLMHYDAVVAFEVVEHVADPDVLLAAMRRWCKQDGSMFVSTPNGVDHGGDLPDWAHVEPKGHVRVYTPSTFAKLLERHGTVVDIVLGPDGTLTAQVKP